MIGCSGEDESPNKKVTQHKLLENNSSVDTDFLSGFDTCTLSDSFFKTREYLIVNTTPAKKYEGFLSYEINTSFNELLVKEIIFGICSDVSPESNDCSLASNVTLVLNTKFDDAKNHLLQSSGLDYSQEKRFLTDDKNNGPTLRPHLHEGPNETVILYCDTGNL